MTILPKNPVVAMTGIWLLATVVGFTSLHRYSNTPAPSGAVQKQAPRESRITFDRTKPTLMVFLHPHCPCSDASVESIEALKQEFGTSVDYYAIFVRPEKTETDWAKSSLYQHCMADKDLKTIIDDNGAEALKYGALSSGQAYVYGPDHRLRFSGGLTPSRGATWTGHERKLVEAALTDKLAKPGSAPVFGCALF